MIHIDRELVLKLLGENNIVILEDQIFNIINILEVFREVILKKREISNKDLTSSVIQLHKINNFILDIEKDLQTLDGFTNSKAYLIKYLNSFNLNILELVKSIEEDNHQGFILHTNTLMDLALKY